RDLGPKPPDDLYRAHGRDQPRVARAGGDDQRFGDDHADERRWGCPEGLSNPDLPGALGDRNQHQVADADDAGQQRSDADDPDEGVDPGEDARDAHEAFEVVVDAHGAAVLWGELEPLGHQVPEGRLDLLAALDAGVAEREQDLVHRVWHVVDELRGRDRHEDAPQLGLPASVLEDADHLVFEPPELDVFADRRLLSEEEGLGDRADHRHLATLLQVELVQVATGDHLGLLEVLVSGVDAAHLEGGALVLAADGELPPEIKAPGDVLDLRHVARHGLVVWRLEVDVASRAATGVWDAGHAAGHGHGVD